MWADVITVLPHVIHEFYGDRDVLEKTYRAMRRWVGWFDDRTRDGLALIGGFGDWVSLEATPPEFCGAAYYVYSSRLLAESAELLGHTQEARRDRERAEQAAEAFHRHFYRPEHQRYEPDTQTAQAFPLALDITPPAERQAVADHLAESVKARDAKPATGFIGTAFLLPVLSRYGHLELAGRVLNTDAYPSLGYMLERRGDHGLGAVELRQGGAGHELA